MDLQISFQSGSLYYRLPAPPGHWMPNAKCNVNRRPCKHDHDKCAIEAECRLIADGDSVNGDGQTPVTITGKTTSCTQAEFVQPCAWNESPGLIGQKIYTFNVGDSNEKVPYVCAAGMLGSNETEFQTSPKCAGRCPAGYYCPTEPTVVPTICPAGSFCPAGVAAPVPCLAGTYGNATGLTSGGACVPVPAGYYSPTGSALPKKCLESGFYCPGAADDTLMTPPGSEPVPVKSGGNTVEETTLVAGATTTAAAVTMALELGEAVTATNYMSNRQQPGGAVEPARGEHQPCVGGAGGGRRVAHAALVATRPALATSATLAAAAAAATPALTVSTDCEPIAAAAQPIAAAADAATAAHLRSRLRNLCVRRSVQPQPRLLWLRLGRCVSRKRLQVSGKPQSERVRLRMHQRLFRQHLRRPPRQLRTRRDGRLQTM